MISENKHGQSLPSYKLKILTLTKDEAEKRKLVRKYLKSFDTVAL